MSDKVIDMAAARKARQLKKANGVIECDDPVEMAQRLRSLLTEVFSSGTLVDLALVPQEKAIHTAYYKALTEEELGLLGFDCYANREPERFSSNFSSLTRSRLFPEYGCQDHNDFLGVLVEELPAKQTPATTLIPITDGMERLHRYISEEFNPTACTLLAWVYAVLAAYLDYPGSTLVVAEKADSRFVLRFIVSASQATYQVSIAVDFSVFVLDQDAFNFVDKKERFTN